MGGRKTVVDISIGFERWVHTGILSVLTLTELC